MKYLRSKSSFSQRKGGLKFYEDFKDKSSVISHGWEVDKDLDIDNGVEFKNENKVMYLTSKNNPFLNGQPREMSFVIKATNTNSDVSKVNAILFGRFSNSPAYPQVAFLNKRVILYNNSNNYIYSADEIEVGEEYTIIITTDGTIANTIIYIDGIGGRHQPTSSNVPIKWETIYMGKSGEGSSVYSECKVSLIKIYDRILTESEVHRETFKEREYNELVLEFPSTEWSDVANVEKTFYAEFEGKENVTKIKSKAAGGITISPLSSTGYDKLTSIAGRMYYVELEVYVPSDDGAINFYPSSSYSPRPTTTERDKWTTVSFYFLGGKGVHSSIYLNTVANGKEAYIGKFKMWALNELSKDLDFYFKPEDNDGTKIRNYADETNGLIKDTQANYPKQLKYGGMKFETDGLATEKPFGMETYGVETYAVVFSVRKNETNSWIFTSRDGASGGLGVLMSASLNLFEVYCGTAGGALNAEVYPVNTIIIRRAYSFYDVFLNGVLVKPFYLIGNNAIVSGNRMFLGKRGGTSGFNFNGNIYRFMRYKGYLDDFDIRKLHYDLIRTVKSGEIYVEPPEPPEEEEEGGEE